MSNSAEVAIAGAGHSTSSSLSEAQLSAFWAGILSHTDAARRMAGLFVSRENVDDIVHTATIHFVESLEPPRKARFPKTDDEFRRRFLVIVRNHAINCIHDRNASEHPIHTHWGV